MAIPPQARATPNPLTPPTPRRFTQAFQQNQARNRIISAENTQAQADYAEQLRIFNQQQAEIDAQNALVERYNRGTLSYIEFEGLNKNLLEKNAYGGIGSNKKVVLAYIQYQREHGVNTQEAERMLPSTGQSYTVYGAAPRATTPQPSGLPQYIQDAQGKPISKETQEQIPASFPAGSSSANASYNPIVYDSYSYTTKDIVGNPENARFGMRQTFSPAPKLAQAPTFIDQPTPHFTEHGIILDQAYQSSKPFPEEKRFSAEKTYNYFIESAPVRAFNETVSHANDYLGMTFPTQSAQYNRGKKIVGNYFGEFVGNELLAAKQLSEAPYNIGSNIGFGLADLGRGIGKGFSEYISPGQPGEYTPYGYAAFLLRGPGFDKNNYAPLISDTEFKAVRERGAIVLGTGVALLPYAAGGAISQVQRAADIGSAFRTSPAKAVTLIGVGAASNVLFNEVGSVGRVIKGQLGGTIVGSVGFAKNFEDITQTGGKILGVALLAPYVAQEAPVFYNAYETANAKKFGEAFSNIQQTSGPLHLGGEIGQKISTGFTLFKETPYAVTSGGVTAPTETLARKRLIANVFDALPGTKASKYRTLYESQGFTKEKFLESYDTVFGNITKGNATSLNGRKFEVREFDVKNIEAVQNEPRAQRIINQYLQEHAGEFRIYGSGVQKPQLNNNPDIRISGDIDVLAPNPKKFLEGLQGALVKGGYSPSDFSLNVVSGSSVSLQFGGEKFINVHDFSVGPKSNLFGQLETVADVFPRRVFVETPSGIHISELRFQAERKIVGGFVDLREKDIADVLTLTKGIKTTIATTPQAPAFSFFSENGFNLERFLPSNQPKASNEQFSLTLKGAIETNLGIYPKGAKVKDVLKIGEASAPVKEISRITGVGPKEIVSTIGNTNIDVLEGGIKEIKGGFATGKEPAAIAQGVTQPIIGVRRFQGISGTESILAHEGTHAVDAKAGLLGTVNQAIPYQDRPQEIRAFEVQEKFLESIGQNPARQEPIFGTLGYQITKRLFAVPPTSVPVGGESAPLLLAKTSPTSAIKLVGGADYGYYSFRPIENYGSYYPTAPRTVYPVFFAPKYAPIYPAQPKYTVPVVTPYSVSPPPEKVPYKPIRPESYPTLAPPNYPNITPPREPVYTTPTPPVYPPFTPPRPQQLFPTIEKKLTVEKNQPLQGAFLVQSKKGGKVFTFKTKLTLEDAYNFGANVVSNTARGSFRVIKTPGFAKPKGIAPSRTPFVQGKGPGGFLVEPAKFRLNIASEHREVTGPKRTPIFKKKKGRGFF